MNKFAAVSHAVAVAVAVPALSFYFLASFLPAAEKILLVEPVFRVDC